MKKNDPHKCEPAFSLIERCGGHKIVAGWTKRTLRRVYFWHYSNLLQNGTDGLIPHGCREIMKFRAWQDLDIKLIDADFEKPRKRKRRGGPT